MISDHDLTQAAQTGDSRAALIVNGRPQWSDVSMYTAEWWRRYEEWHLAKYPGADEVTRANLRMLVNLAETRGAA